MAHNNSPAAGTPQTPNKAYAASALAFVTIVVSAWLADDSGVTGQDIAGWLVTAVLGSGLTGGATFATKNKPQH